MIMVCFRMHGVAGALVLQAAAPPASTAAPLPHTHVHYLAVAAAPAGNSAILGDLRRLNKQRQRFGDEDPGMALVGRLKVRNGALA